MVPQSFLALRFATTASATPPNDPTKPTQEGVFQSTLPLSAHGWLVSLQGRRGNSAKRTHAVEPSTYRPSRLVPSQKPFCDTSLPACCARREGLCPLA
jgi:hypothetical protein